MSSTSVSPAGFTQNALWQLNLMIWLGLPSYFVKPIFYNEGFELYLIEGVIAPPDQAMLRANVSKPKTPMRAKPSPDLVFRNNVQQHLLTIECKVSAFSNTSTSRVAQANAILVCDGPHLATRFGLNNPAAWQAGALYVVSDADQDHMEVTLDDLVAKIHRRKIAVIYNAPTSFGISIESDGVWLNFKNPARIPFPVGLREKVLDRVLDEPPIFLYLIPVHPTIPADGPKQDKYGRDQLTERLRAALLTEIGQQVYDGSVTVDWDKLMSSAIIIWHQWGEEGKDNLLSPFKQFVRELFRVISKKFGATIDESQFAKKIVLNNVAPAVANRIMNYMTSNAYEEMEIDLGVPLQLPLPPDQQVEH